MVVRPLVHPLRDSLEAVEVQLPLKAGKLRLLEDPVLEVGLHVVDFLDSFDMDAPTMGGPIDELRVEEAWGGKEEMQLLREGNVYSPPPVDRFLVFFQYLRVGRM